jgi:hypothetical protein
VLSLHSANATFSEHKPLYMSQPPIFLNPNSYSPTQACLLPTKMPTYYVYGEQNPSALQTPDTGRWEDTNDWPRTYQYIPAYGGYQGFHPPAPVYQAQAPAPAVYYYACNVSALAHLILACIPIIFRLSS